MTAKLIWIDDITQRPAIRCRTSRSASRSESDSKRSASSVPRPIVLQSMIPDTESDSVTPDERTETDSCGDFATQHRYLHTNRARELTRECGYHLHTSRHHARRRR